MQWIKQTIQRIESKTVLAVPGLIAGIRRLLEFSLIRIFCTYKRSIPYRLNDFDNVYTFLRNELYDFPNWYYNPERIWNTANLLFKVVGPYMRVEGKTYLDLGCGTFNPYGLSAIMFLNGAASTIAIDIDHKDSQRAAQALFDLLVDCYTNQDKWCWSTISRDKYISRLDRFNMTALKAGQLADGIAGLPFQHLVCDMITAPVADGSVDLISSHVVLEHLSGFETATGKLFAIMASGGIGIHHVDFSDHRHYRKPAQYHQWSFLTQENNPLDGHCNRLRPSEMRQILQTVGFEICSIESLMQEKMPIEVRKQLANKYAGMPNEELEMTHALFVIRKP